MKNIFILGVFVILSLACEKQLSEEEQFNKDKELIEEYLSKNNLVAQKTNTGLYYIIEKEGDGNHPATNSTVTVRYKGYLLSGQVFDQSENGITIGLHQVITGWREGIPKLSTGGEGVLLIPSKLGYGSQSTGNIPANSVLIFDVKLLDF